MIEHRLAELLDKQAIVEVLYRYARGWDRRDEAALRDCFHVDAAHEHGSFKGLSQDFITRGLANTKAVRSMSHLITNPLIDTRGRKAVSECSFLAHHRLVCADGEEDRFLKGRYVDVFERRDGVWRIAYRRGVHDFERVVAAADRALAHAPSEQLSRHKPDDVLYPLLESLHAEAAS